MSALGAFPLPIEVAPCGWHTTAELVEAVFRGADVDGTEGARRVANGKAFLSDEGNFILDYRLGRIGDPATLATALNTIPGVVENGLFIGMASRAMIGAADGTAREVRPV